MNRALRGIHARANRELIMALNKREAASVGHLQQLPVKPETH
jgi:hypothetical protein